MAILRGFPPSNTIQIDAPSKRICELCGKEFWQSFPLSLHLSLDSKTNFGILPCRECFVEDQGGAYWSSLPNKWGDHFHVYSKVREGYTVEDLHKSYEAYQERCKAGVEPNYHQFRFERNEHDIKRFPDEMDQIMHELGSEISSVFNEWTDTGDWKWADGYDPDRWDRHLPLEFNILASTKMYNMLARSRLAKNGRLKSKKQFELAINYGKPLKNFRPRYFNLRQMHLIPDHVFFLYDVPKPAICTRKSDEESDSRQPSGH